MTPGGADAPSGDLAAAIDAACGSYDEFKARFQAAAGGQFGSGWGWLCSDASGTVSVVATANQDSPHMHGLTPISGRGRVGARVLPALSEPPARLPRERSGTW